MKRIFSLLAVCTLAISAMAQNAGITLSYNKGKELKFFRSNQLKEAINAAEINDTLYFSAGSFDLDQLPTINDDYYAREWSKPLVVIGAGAQDNGTTASISGTLWLKFPESISLDQRNVSFEGIHITNWVSPASEINNLTFRNFRGTFVDSNVWINNTEGSEDWVKPHTYINNVIFDRCYIGQMNLEERNVDKIQVLNSKLNSVSGQCSERGGQVFTLDHCRIYELSGGFIGLVQNSAIMWNYSDNNSRLNSTGINQGFYNSLTDDKCVILSDFNWEDDEVLSVREGGGSVTLADGTMMGTLKSFSLYPSYPTLDPNKSDIDYDGINGTVTITVKLLGEK